MQRWLSARRMPFAQIMLGLATGVVETSAAAAKTKRAVNRMLISVTDYVGEISR
jgi:hypothetical protein